MPRVIFSPSALHDLRRLREFLHSKNPLAARRAGKAIVQAAKALADQPQIGRPAEGMEPEYREWPVDFGDSGYLALYRYDGGTVTVVAVRHQKEVGF